MSLHSVLPYRPGYPPPPRPDTDPTPPPLSGPGPKHGRVFCLPVNLLPKSNILHCSSRLNIFSNEHGFLPAAGVFSSDRKPEYPPLPTLPEPCIGTQVPKAFGPAVYIAGRKPQLNPQPPPLDSPGVPPRGSRLTPVQWDNYHAAEELSGRAFKKLDFDVDSDAQWVALGSPTWLPVDSPQGVPMGGRLLPSRLSSASVQKGLELGFVDICQVAAKHPGMTTVALV